MAAATLVEHLSDDPVVLALQLSRKLPEKILRPLAMVASQLPGMVLPALAEAIEGRVERLESRFAAAANKDLRPRTAVRLADIATASGLLDAADQLLASVPASTVGMAGAQARLYWYRGNMSSAVARLASGSAAERRLRQRLFSELSVFDGWRPELPTTNGYRPRGRVVLHLLTNSLPYTGSGYAQRSHSLLKAQAEQGWNVHAVTRIGYPVQVGGLLASRREVLDGVTYHRLLPMKLPRGLQARLQLQTEEILALAKELRPAVLHTTTHFVNGLAIRAVAESLDVPWIYEVRGQLADTWASTRGVEAKASERYHKFTKCEAAVIRSADAIATLGETMLKGVLDAGISKDKTLLLPNAVGEEFLKVPLDPAEARSKLGLPEAGLFIGTVSSLVEYEGLDDLIRAYAILAPKRPDLSCLIVGSGASAPGLKDLAEELGVASKVYFPGRVPRTTAHLYHQALDVFVAPRKDLDVTRSVTPLKPVEALASGRPVVFSDLPALREIVHDGTDGLAAPPNDPTALADVLDVLLQNRAMRVEMGATGRNRMLETRTWQSLAKRMSGVYEQLGQENDRN